MIRALAVIGIGVSAAYIAANGWEIAGLDLMSLPLALVVFSLFCGGLMMTLKSL